jgi:hypothetical protein
LLSNIWFAGIIVVGLTRFERLNPLDIGFFLGNLVLTASFYWRSSLANTRLAENKLMKEVMVRLRNKMADALKLDDKVKDWDSLKDEVKGEVEKANNELNVLRSAKEEGEEKRRSEFDAKDVDEIVFMPEDSTGFERYREKMERDNLIRKDISRIVSWGSQDGDTFLNALSAAGDWQGKVKLFVFIPKGVRPNDPRVELTIKNMYGAAASMPPGGGLVLANAGDAYVNSFVKHAVGADMTFGTTWANLNDLLQDQSLPWIVTDIYNGWLNIRKMFENFNLKAHLDKDKRELGRSTTINILKDRGVDLDNIYSKQFSVFNGIVLMGPKAVDMFTTIAHELNGESLRMNADLFIPILMATAHGIGDQEGLVKEIIEYVQAQHVNGNGGFQHHDSEEAAVAMIQALIGEKTRLYNRITRVARKGEFQDIETMVHFPSREAERFEPYSSDHRAQQLAQAVKDAAQTTEGKGRGGIDLNFQPQFIQRPSGQSPANIQGTDVIKMPDGFKGFNFNIVRFTANLTVNSAFQLMFMQ